MLNLSAGPSTVFVGSSRHKSKGSLIGLSYEGLDVMEVVVLYSTIMVLAAFFSFPRI